LELRFPLPPDVQGAFLDGTGKPRRCIIKSLGTADVQLANAKADLLRASIRAEISQVRQARASLSLGDFLRELYDKELEAFHAQTARDARMRLVSADGDLAPSRVLGRSAYAKALTSPDPNERAAVAGWAAERYLRSQGKNPKDATDLPEIIDQCAQALVDALTAQGELAEGRPLPPTTSALIAAATSRASKNTNAASENGHLPVSRYFKDVYLPVIEQQGAIRGQNTISGKALAVELFAGLLDDPAIGAITKGDLWRFHDMLSQLPNSRELKQPHRHLSPKDQIEARRKGTITAAGIHPKTVNKHLSGIKTLLDFAEQRHDIISAPTHGVRARVPDGEESGRAFTTDELNRIFSQPLFAGCSEGVSPQGLQKPGSVQIRDDRFWIPLVLLFTGARPSEIAGLESADVVVDHEVPHFLIRPNGTRGIKNPKSKRMVPVHEKLIRMGFLEFAGDRERQVGGRFFPMAQQQYFVEGATNLHRKKNLSSCPILRQFNRTILADADARRDRGSLKCFRNTFEQEAMSHIPSDEMRRRLTGRDVGSTVQVYTQNIPDDPIKRTAQLRMLAGEINKVTYPAVQLDHLFKSDSEHA
jgi:integrase